MSLREMTSVVRKSPPLTIVLLAALLGLVLFMVEPGHRYIPDERAHFFRAYQVSEGHITAGKLGNSRGGYLPASIDNFSGQPFRQPLNSSDLKFLAFDGSAPYTPILYIPQAIGIFIARTFHLSPTVILYFARVANFLAWLAMVYLALKIAGKWAWGLGAFVLLPMCIFQSTTTSADVASIGLTLIFVALLIQALTRTKKITQNETLVLGGVSLLLALAKQPLFLLPLTTLAIMPARFKDKRQQLKYLALWILPGVVLALLWSFLSKDVNVTNGNLIANHHAQLLFITHHPFSFVQAVLATHLPSTSYLLVESLTTPALWIGLHTLLWSVMISYAVIVVAYFELSDKTIVMLQRRQKLILAAVILLMFLVIDGTLYLYFTVVGSSHITGLQGRYFLPLLIVLLPVLKNKKSYINIDRAALSRVIIAGSLITFTVFCVILTHGYPLHAIRYKLLFGGHY